MKEKIHLAAGVLALLTIATFLLATVAVEFFGSLERVALVKHLIVVPGLFILVPALAATGGTGFALAQTRGGRLVDAKKRRMPVIAANGLFILVPCAVVLDRWAASGTLGIEFYLVQALELFAGGLNLVLMGLNARDGLRLTHYEAPIHVR